MTLNEKRNTALVSVGVAIVLWAILWRTVGVILGVVVGLAGFGVVQAGARWWLERRGARGPSADA